MIGLVTALIPIVLKLVGWWLDKVGADNATKRKFLESVADIKEKGLASVKLNESWEAQLERLRQSPPQ